MKIPSSGVSTNSVVAANEFRRIRQTLLRLGSNYKRGSRNRRICRRCRVGIRHPTCRASHRLAAICGTVGNTSADLHGTPVSLVLHTTRVAAQVPLSKQLGPSTGGEDILINLHSALHQLRSAAGKGGCEPIHIFMVACSQDSAFSWDLVPGRTTSLMPGSFWGDDKELT